MPKRVVAIHQPNFFPWRGYFDKIRRADVFIFLDDAQFPKTGGSWSNRVNILMQNKAKWLTAPIDRTYSGVRSICEMTFSDQVAWRQKLLKTLHSAYECAPFFQQTMALLTPLISNPQQNVAAYNMHAVQRLCDAFGIKEKEFVRSSGLGVKATGTERLVALTQAVGGTEYLCGGGADGYQDDALFAKSGVGLTYQNFRETPYPQAGIKEFVPGLSVIDMLMHTGAA